jgi:HlyD family secretion protein
VKQIRNSPQTLQNVVTYDAVVDVSNPDLKLRPGMTANVTFVYAEQLDVLRVPNAALRFRPAPEAEPKGGGPRAGGTKTLTKTLVKASDPSTRKRTLYVLRGEKAVPVEVTTGITDGSYTELVAGELREGDTVITDTASTGVKPAAPGGGQMPMRRVL